MVLKDSAVGSEGVDVATVNPVWAAIVSSTELGKEEVGNTCLWGVSQDVNY